MLWKTKKCPKQDCRLGLLSCYPIARFIKHVKLHLFQQYIQSDGLCHGCSLLDACVATIKLYPSRTKPSVIRARDYHHAL